MLADLATVVSQAGNVILLGPPGVARIHLATGLGVKPAQAGYSVLFDTASSLRHPSRPGALPVASIPAADARAALDLLTVAAVVRDRISAAGKCSPTPRYEAQSLHQVAVDGYRRRILRRICARASVLATRHTW